MKLVRINMTDMRQCSNREPSVTLFESCLQLKWLLFKIWTRWHLYETYSYTIYDFGKLKPLPATEKWHPSIRKCQREIRVSVDFIRVEPSDYRIPAQAPMSRSAFEFVVNWNRYTRQRLNLLKNNRKSCSEYD